MPRPKLHPICMLLVSGLFAGACAEAQDPLTTEAPAEGRATTSDPIAPIPLRVDLDLEKVALGARLFGDRRLSKDDAVACADCHLPALGLADGRALSHVAGRPEAGFNATTLYNVGYNDRFNWTGKFTSLEEQTAGAMGSAAAMATPWPDAVHKLQQIPAYQGAFRALYHDGLTPTNAAEVVAEYERSLRTPNGRFDRFLRGDEAALGEEERAGWALFKSYGCISCHQGINVGGNLFERFGVFSNYLEDRGEVKERDLGRFAVTHRAEDRFVFRVPSLRNVALTAPYFHDGSAPTLPVAVEVMSRVQLGRGLEPRQIDAIVAFLGTLTGEPTP